MFRLAYSAQGIEYLSHCSISATTLYITPGISLFSLSVNPVCSVCFLLTVLHASLLLMVKTAQGASFFHGSGYSPAQCISSTPFPLSLLVSRACSGFAIRMRLLYLRDKRFPFRSENEKIKMSRSPQGRVLHASFKVNQWEEW